jgi:hypothetical protein
MNDETLYFRSFTNHIFDEKENEDHDTYEEELFVVIWKKAIEHSK